MIRTRLPTTHLGPRRRLLRIDEIESRETRFGVSVGTKEYETMLLRSLASDGRLRVWEDTVTDDFSSEGTLCFEFADDSALQFHRHMLPDLVNMTTIL